MPSGDCRVPIESSSVDWLLTSFADWTFHNAVNRHSSLANSIAILQSPIANRQSLLFEFHDRNPSPPLVVGCRPEAGDGRVGAQELGDGAAQLPGSVAVDDPHAPQVRHQHLVEEP